MSGDFIFTSVSVTAGHPDKLCDQVSDAIVDHYLMHDPHARIVAESALASGVLFISAHFASTATLDVANIARAVMRDAGYPRSIFDADGCTILTSLMDHSAREYHPLDLQGMDDKAIDRVTAKHQVTVFGYACTQTPDLMPLPIWLAHRLAAALGSPKAAKALPYLLPDAKAQVAIEYKDNRPERVHSVTLIASQQDDAVGLAQLREDLYGQVIDPVLADAGRTPDSNTLVFVNPEGPLIGGGPAAHAGLTGRKTGIDAYGEYARHSGAALSGKDPWRIDRVGAYAARYAAKNLVAAGYADECEVQLSYAVGMAQPVSLRVQTFGTGKEDERTLEARLMEVFDFRPAAIVRDLGLQDLPADRKGGFYRQLAAYGHMGRTDINAPWERTDKKDDL